jgi:divalent metal cation (Fe/Co/Zn/Cd) transporter
VAGQGHGTKAIVAALFANLGIAVAKFAGFLITRSSALLAEAIHSVADSGNQALLLLGGRQARRGLETWSFRTAVGEANAVREGKGWWAFVRQAKMPELPVVLLEDLGALLGLVIALIGVGLVVVTGDPAWDAYATLAIGALLAVIAVVLAAEMKSLLLGEAATARDVVAIRQAIEASPGVRRLLHLKTQHLGPEELLVAAKVELDGDLDFAGVVEVIDDAERRVRERLPIARVMYIEPDLPEATLLT